MIRESAFKDIYSQEVTPDEGTQMRPMQEDRALLRQRPLTMVVAAAADNAIGRAGEMLWHIPADLKHFKQVTTGGTVIMGRKTWESLPKRPLPGRRNIVLTSSKNYDTPGAETATTLADALDSAHTDAAVFIIGGGEIYRQALPLADTVELTRIEAVADDADTFFPPLDPSEWILVDKSDTFAAGEHHPQFRFETWKRR